MLADLDYKEISAHAIKLDADGKMSAVLYFVHNFVEFRCGAELNKFFVESFIEMLSNQSDSISKDSLDCARYYIHDELLGYGARYMFNLNDDVDKINKFADDVANEFTFLAASACTEHSSKISYDLYNAYMDALEQ